MDNAQFKELSFKPGSPSKLHKRQKWLGFQVSKYPELLGVVNQISIKRKQGIIPSVINEWILGCIPNYFNSEEGQSLLEDISGKLFTSDSKLDEINQQKDFFVDFLTHLQVSESDGIIKCGPSPLFWRGGIMQFLGLFEIYKKAGKLNETDRVAFFNSVAVNYFTSLEGQEILRQILGSKGKESP